MNESCSNASCPPVRTGDGLDILRAVADGRSALGALVGVVASNDQALAWIADRALARAIRTRPLLRFRSTPEERAKASRDWADHFRGRR